MPHLTSIAGRHAADRARQRAAAAAEARQLVSDAARETLRRTIAAHGIRVLDRLTDAGHELRVQCSVDQCARDSELLDAIITDHGFALDPTRISRFRDRWELVHLHQPATGATVTVVISRPGSLHRGGEAA